MRRLAAALSACVLGAGCSALDPIFQCTSDEQCVNAGLHGTCEPTGACSFPDPSCPSGRRIAQHSGAASGSCAEDSGDGGGAAPDGGSGAPDAGGDPGEDAGLDPNRPQNTALPTIEGTFRDGELLTAQPGVWLSAAPPSFSFQWRRCDAQGEACADLAGATSAQHLAGPDDVGRALRVFVVASLPSGAGVALSEPTPPIAAIAPSNLTPPVFKGRAVEGRPLDVDPGTWAGTIPRFAYQWQRCDAAGAGCAEIAGATSAQYTPLAADARRALKAVVTAANAAASISVATPPSAPVLPKSTGIPFGGRVNAVALQADGGRLLAGTFRHVDGVPTPLVARFLGDGSLDPGFGPEGSGLGYHYLDASVSGAVLDRAGRLLLAGRFDSHDGTPVGGLVRLHPNGSLERAFTAPDTPFTAVALDAHGRLLAARNVAQFSAEFRLTRYLEDATPDPTFDSTAFSTTWAVTHLVFDSKGRILVAGDTCNASPCPMIARLLENGAPDGSFNAGGAGFSASVDALAVDSQDRAVVGLVTPSTFNGAAAGCLARLNEDGSLDSSFPAPRQLTGHVAGLAVDAAGRILAGGSFSPLGGSQTWTVARFNPDGTLDRNLVPESWQGSGVEQATAMALDPLGRILVGGSYPAGGGLAPRLMRLTEDLLPDPTFQQPSAGLNEAPRTLIAGGEGTLYAVGSFLTFGGSPRQALARLRSDGALDTAFVPEVDGTYPMGRAVVVEPSGSILLGGNFYDSSSGQSKALVRLRADGTRDPSLAAASPNAGVRSLALVGGKIIVGGDFTSWGGTRAPCVARLNPDGTLDSSFAATGTGLSGRVAAVAVDGAGGVLVGGDLTAYGPTPLGGLARLRPDGSLDADFVARLGGQTGWVDALALDASGRILVVGTYWTWHLTRLLPDGSPDPSFIRSAAGFQGSLRAVAVDPAGRILVGGYFTTYQGTAARYLVRLNPDGSLDTSWPGASLNGGVTAFALEPGGAMHFVGDFTNLGGAPAWFYGAL